MPPGSLDSVSAFTPTLVAPSPAEGFCHAVECHGADIALEIGEQQWTYTGLSTLSAAIAREIGTIGSRTAFIGVLASRSLTAVTGTLAVFGAGAVHVALNPAHPARRSASVLDQAEVSTLIVGNEGLPALAELLKLVPRIRCVIAPETADLSAFRAIHTDVRLVDSMALRPGGLLTAPHVLPDDLAYLVFASGSTGEPKGIAVSHGNLAAYTRNFRALAAPLATDRVATTCELTFDIALQDMFQTWFSGATLCVVPARQLLAPARLIRSQRITYWFSAASAAMLMEHQGTLRPGVFPLLRVSVLCGEALPARTAGAWAAAAPASALYNVYGPTETTTELAFYRWNASSNKQERSW